LPSQATQEDEHMLCITAITARGVAPVTATALWFIDVDVLNATADIAALTNSSVRSPTFGFAQTGTVRAVVWPDSSGQMLPQLNHAYGTASWDTS